MGGYERLHFSIDLKHKHDPIPTKMLALMAVLEEDGPAFAQKMAITLTSGQDRGLVYQVNNTNSLLHVIKYDEGV